MRDLAPLIWFALAALAFLAAWRFFGTSTAIMEQIETLDNPSNSDVAPLENAGLIQFGFAIASLIAGLAMLVVGFLKSRRRKGDHDGA